VGPYWKCKEKCTSSRSSYEPGKAYAEIELVFGEQWFSDENVIVGEKNEVYPLQVLADPTPEGGNWVYRVALITGDADLFVPAEELAAGKRFSKDWSLVEQTLSKKGGLVNFTSPFKMRNSFSMTTHCPWKHD
jgi:hypothetical protein